MDKSVGLAWWWNMVQGKKMQSKISLCPRQLPAGSEILINIVDPYGSTESTRVDGKLVSALVTWDSKVTTVVSLLGGVGDLVRTKLKADGIYNDFITIANVRVEGESLYPERDLLTRTYYPPSVSIRGCLSN